MKEHAADDIGKIIDKQALDGMEAVEHTMLLIKETEVYNGTDTGGGEVVEMLHELAANDTSGVEMKCFLNLKLVWKLLNTQ